MVENGFPMVVRDAHLFLNPPESSTLQSVITGLINLVGTTIFNRTLLHSNLTAQERKAKVMSFGFRETDIPVFLGGSFGVNNFQKWFRERRASEWKRSLTLGTASLPLHEATHHPIVPMPFATGINYLLQEQSNEPWTIEQLEKFLTLTDFGQSDSLPRHGHLESDSRKRSTIQAHSHSISRQMILTGKAVTCQGTSSRDSGALPSHLATTMPRNQIPGNTTTNNPNSAIARLTCHIRTSRSRSFATDVYTQLGIAAPKQIHETDTLLKLGQLAVEEAIQSMPHAQAAAYIQALQHCPMLVQKESPVIHFLRRDNFDPVAAATRLARYWRMRIDLFGSNAFLSLNQSGQGALSRDDLVVLSSGVFAVLPNDNANRGVIVEDRSRSLENTVEAIQSKLRSLFYLLSVLAEDAINQCDGIVWLSSLITPRVTELNIDNVARCMDILEVIPIRIKAYHFFVIPPKTAKKAQAEQIVSYVSYTLVAKYGKRVLLHTGDSPDTLLDKIVKFGIWEKNIPAVFGGSWRYEEFTKWMRERGQRQLESAAAAAAASISIGSALAVGGENLVMDVMKNKPMSEEERKERKRKLNIIHSRQKRERRKVEAMGLIQQKQINFCLFIRAERLISSQ